MWKLFKIGWWIIMANKINWEFQDEKGNNLNQYKSIDQTTNEQKIIKLLRDANITQEGTPLNSTNLNLLIKAINEAYLIELDSGDGVPKNLTNGGIFLKKVTY